MMLGTHWVIHVVIRTALKSGVVNAFKRTEAFTSVMGGRGSFVSPLRFGLYGDG